MAHLDANVLHRLYAAYAPGLWLYARQWLTATEAEDAVQDAFVRLLEQRQAPNDIKPWMYNVLRHSVISRHRSMRRRGSRERIVAQARGWFEPSKLDVAMDAAAAEKALRSLPEAQREVVVLKLWSGMTYQQISDLTAQALSTVYDHYRAALRQLRQQLESPCSNSR